MSPISSPRPRGFEAESAEIPMPSSPASPWQATSEGDGALPTILAACRLVGEAQGIRFRVPRAHRPRATRRDALASVCNASGVRIRHVLLRPGWWRKDNGPLLGFRAAVGEDVGEAVALIPVSPGHYDLVETGKGTRRRIGAEEAVGLAPEAYTFYTPLPRRSLTLPDLLRAGMRGCRSEVLTLLMVGMAGGLLALLIPVATGYVAGTLIPEGDRDGLYQLAAGLVVAAFAAALFAAVRNLAVLRIETRVDREIQAAVWDHLLALPVSFFRRFSVGDLHTRAMGVEAIRHLLSGYVLSAVLALPFSLFSFALLFHYSAPLALVATALVGGLGCAVLTAARRQVFHQRALREHEGRVAGLLFDLLGGVVKLRVGGAEKRALGEWERRFGQQQAAVVRVQRLSNMQAVVRTAYGVLSPLTIFAMAGLSARMRLPAAEFLAFNAALAQFQAAVFAVLAVVAEVLDTVPLYERMKPILEATPEVGELKPEAGVLTGDIELRDVSFRYDTGGQPVLDGVTLRAGPGELVALVGPSGSGKSTCLRLILGFERPESGEVLFDGRDLVSLDVTSVRRQMGVVLQNGQPMVGTVYSNITGSRSLGAEEAWWAARQVGLEDEIRALPMGLYTFINENGTNFSGGQRQRLMIAHAIVSRPRIVLLDEATSALDNRTQALVSRSLEELRATRLVIAHRLSTIMNADRIYVLDRGRVDDAGTFDELVRRKGVFAKMAARQRL